jgi:hypothetical protein
MGAKNYKVAKRLYTIGQFARFIRPEWQRISATDSPASGVNVTAYKDPATGNFAIVAMNNGSSNQSITYNLKGFSASSVIPYTTSATQNIEAGSEIALSGSSFTANIASKSIVTFVGAAPSKKLTGDVKPDFAGESAAEVKSNFKVEAAGKTSLTDKNGYFEIKDLSEDDSIVTVKISKDGFLTREIEDVEVSDKGLGSASKPVEVWAGDMNGDGAINMTDVNQVAQYFNTSSKSPKYNATADFNKDNSINMSDIMIIASHFNKNAQKYPAL